MPLAQAIAVFKASVSQCENLIANAHMVDQAGAPILPLIDRQQITVAAFLNMFIAWEVFLETSLTNLMVGNPTANGSLPVRYVAPPDVSAAQKMVIGTMRFFDYANHENVSKIVKMYFANGYPYEPHFSGIIADLGDLRTMRNSAAHISSTTQSALESLALRIFGQPKPGIDLYGLLTTAPQGSADTVFASYKDKLIAAAELISQG